MRRSGCHARSQPSSGSILDARFRLVEGFTRQLGGQVEREDGNNGTIVCLTLPSREASYDFFA